MKFFIPYAENDSQTKNVYETIVNSTKKIFECEIDVNIKIQEIEYKHDGNIYLAEVGKLEKRNNMPNGELVFVILKSVAYLVCTTNRGIMSGDPILIGMNDVIKIKYFDE